MRTEGIIAGLDGTLLYAAAASIAGVVIIGMSIYFFLINRENKK